MVLLLAQERRVEALRRVTTAGRQLHYEWVERVFEPWLCNATGDARTWLRAQLIAITDVHIWEVLRRDLGLERESAEASMRQLVTALLDDWEMD
jgi:hypothetical protein